MINKVIYHLRKWLAVYVPIFLGIALLLISQTELQLVPDYLGISKLNEPLKVIEVIVSVLSSIVGILLAIVLIGFEMIRNRQGRIGVQRFLQNPQIQFLVSLQISIICYGVLMLSFSGKSVGLSEITCIYLLLAFFLVSVFLLLPFGKTLLMESDSYKIIEYECSRINGKSIGEIIGYNYGRLEYKKELSAIDSSPFLILRDIGIKYVNEGNQHIPALIIQESTRKFIPFITNEIDRRALIEGYNALLIIWNGIAVESAKCRNYLPLKQIWNSISEIHKHHSVNGIELIRTEGIRDFFSDFIEICLKTDNDDVVVDGIYQIENIFKLDLVNCPSEELISEIDHIFELNRNTHHDVHVEIQWKYVSTTASDMLKVIIDRSISYKKERVFDTAIFVLTSIIDIARRADLGLYQKHLIIVEKYSYCLYKMQEALKAGIVDSFRVNHFIDKSFISDIIREKPSYLRHIVMDIINHFQILFENNSFDCSRSDFNAFAGKMRLIAMVHSKKEDYSEIVGYVKSFIEWVKEQCEGDISKHYENYLGLHDIIESTIDWHSKTNEFKKDGFVDKNKDEISEEFLDSFKAILKNFNKLDEASRYREKKTIKFK